jgi:NAD(P)-dependent dehydrogenase (short-subunit alcohol dehydrogenase family)
MLLLWWYNPGNLGSGVGTMRLENKVALISGGARGMGAAEARLFAQEGAKVVIGDVLEEDGHQTEAQINESGRECLFVRLDVTSEINWQEAVATTVARFGKLDILVNNAGIYPPALIEDTTEELWDRIMDINGKGVFLGTKCAIPEMRETGGGSIINISSTAGLRGSPGAAAYGASKGAVRLFTKSTAIQYAKDNIRANSVHPGIIETDMTLPTILTDEEARQGRIARIPLGRIGQPDDVAYGVLFLASDESSFMTGSELVIDGGRTAQ